MQPWTTADRSRSSTRSRYIVTVADIADTMHGVQRRAMMEKVFTEGSFIEAQITVQGWFRPTTPATTCDWTIARSRGHIRACDGEFHVYRPMWWSSLKST
jgi:hypothetical protein